MTVRALSLHADYACRRSGACCTSGWAIPVETALHARLTRALDEGTITPPRGSGRLFAPSPGLPAEFAAVLASDERGRCRLYDATGTCALQHQKGHDWLPAACRQFPRIALLDDRGVSVSLSHYCPTAAHLLLRDDVELSIVEGPPAFPADGEYEGLDARGALPPLVRPDVLMDLESFDLWERHAIGVLDIAGRSAEAALAALSADAEAIRAWRHTDGTLVDHVRAVTARAACGRPAEAGPHTPPGGSGSGGTDSSRPDRLDRTLRRYLAARVFASWVAYQGLGLRTLVRSLEAALAVVRAEAGRVVAAAGRGLDEALLVEAIRAADLRLLHLADRQALARDWSAAENPAREGNVV